MGSGLALTGRVAVIPTVVGAAVGDKASTPSFEEDRTLAQLVADGDPQARSLYTRRTFGRAMRIAHAMCADSADAEDAAQECMIALLRGARSYQGRSSLERWADRVAARECIRLDRLRRAREAKNDPSFELDTLDGSPAQTVLRDQMPRPVAYYLSLLPQPQREVLVLRHMLGCSLDEISEHVGAKRATVRYRLASAIKTVRGLVRRDRAVGILGADR